MDGIPSSTSSACFGVLLGRASTLRAGVNIAVSRRRMYSLVHRMNGRLYAICGINTLRIKCRMTRILVIDVDVLVY
jgi:hypothetical protein